MGILKQLERRTHPSSPDGFLTGWFGGRPSATGAVVTPDTALGASAVWRAVSLITKSIASIPLNTYTHLDGGGKSLNTAHALYDLLHNQPNDWQTSYEWREMMVGHLELRGNGYSKIVAAPNGKITALIPLHPDRVQAFYRPITPGGPKVRFYQYLPLDGPPEILFWDEMLHWRGFSLDGVTGISRIAMARETIGVSLAAEEHGARFFSNDATPGGILSHPKTLSAPAQKRLKQSWNERQRGVSHAHEVQVLEEGMTWTTVGVANKDAQFLETRKFQVDEVARWFDIPPHKLMEMGASTFGNIEEQNIEFVTDAVIPRCTNIEQSCMRDLMSREDRKRSFLGFVVKGLLRGDQKGRFEAWSIAKNAGFMSADDIREEENMNPIPGGAGKEYFVPLNMIPAHLAGELASKKADLAPAPAPAADPAPDPEPAARSAHVTELRARIASAHAHILADASLRSLRKEVTAGRRALQQARTTASTAPLSTFADEFYRDHEGFVARSFHAPVRATLEALASLVCLELNAEPLPEVVLDPLALRVAQDLARRHVAASRAALRQTLKAATPDTCGAAVDGQFTSWESTRAASDAREAVRAIIEAMPAAVASASGITVPVPATSTRSAPATETRSTEAPPIYLSLTVNAPRGSTKRSGRAIKGEDGTMTFETTETED